MYFRLEVTVLPLPFFSSTWQHGRRKLLEFDFFTPRRDRCLLASSCFFTPRRSQLLEFDFFTPRRDRCLLFFTPRLVALPPAVDAIDPTPPSLSPRRRTSRRRLPFLRGDGSCSLVLAAALHRADGRGLPIEETDAAETSPSLWSRPCMIHHRRPSISRRRLSFPHPLQ
jgi:hypothetical protein